MTYVLRDPLCSWWEQEPRHYHFRVVLSPASSGSLSCPGRSVLAKDSQQPPVSPSLLCSLCLPPPLSPSLCASFLLSTSPVLNCPGPSHLWSSYPQLRETAGMSGVSSLPCSLNTASRKEDRAIILGSLCFLFMRNHVPSCLSSTI